MKIFENYNKAKQKFGENLAQQAIEAKIPNQFVGSWGRFCVGSWGRFCVIPFPLESGSSEPSP